MADVTGSRPDRARTRCSAASGNDTIFARDGSRDRIRCGSGFDVVFATARDRISDDCERVRFP